MNYWQVQKKAIIESISMHKPAKCYLFEFIKYLLIACITLLAYGMFLYIFNKMQPLFDVIDQIKNYSTDIPSTLQSQFLANSHLFTQFIVSTLSIMVAALIIYLVIISIFDGIITSTIKKQRWTIKTFFAFIKIYSTVTVVLLTIITDPIIFYVTYLVLSLLYIYLMMVYQITLDEKRSYLENVVAGIKNSTRIRHAIILLVAVIIAIMLATLINMLLAILLKQYVIILVLLTAVMLSIWIRNYFFMLYKIKRYI